MISYLTYWILWFATVGATAVALQTTPAEHHSRTWIVVTAGVLLAVLILGLLGATYFVRRSARRARPSSS